MMKMLRMSMYVLALLPIALPVSADQGLTCTNSQLIVACFEAYKTRLRNFHNRQLDAIADRIAESRGWKVPVDYITVVGHSARFKPSDPVEENAKGRAESVAQALEQKLRKRNIDDFEIVTASFGDSQPRATNSTRNGRALNRRAEIILGGRSEVNDHVNALREICVRASGRSRTIKLQSAEICRSIPQAEQTCRRELSPTVRNSLVGASCHPLSAYCVVCRER